MQARATSVIASEIESALERIADSYLRGSRRYSAISDVPRAVFNVSLLSALPRGARIGDIGGGLSLFAPACAAIRLFRGRDPRR